MFCSLIKRRTFMLGLLALLGTAPAEAAGIDSKMVDCRGKPCLRGSITIYVPAGWSNDDIAAQRLGMQVLVRAGQSFIATDTNILAIAINNPGRLSVDAFLAQRDAGYRSRAPRVRI